MILDNLLTFTGTSNGTSGGITSGPQTDAPTASADATNIIDLGLAGIPTSANGGGARDIGTGDDPSLKLSAIITTAFAGGTSLALTLSGAPDNGAGAPGAYSVMWQSPAAVALANLTAGRQLANVDVPRPAPGQPMPRFLKLSYVIVGVMSGGGSIEAQIVIDRDDQVVGTGGAYSGYPAGLTVAN